MKKHTNHNKYLKAIQENVCSICVDSSSDGRCTLTKNEICAVQYFLPQILQVVHSTKSDDIFEFYQALKENVCSECIASSEDDSCYLREDSNCSLDRYFPLIVETIQHVDEEEF